MGKRLLIYIFLIIFVFEGWYLPFFYSHGVPHELVKVFLQLKYMLVLGSILIIRKSYVLYPYEKWLFIVIPFLILSLTYQSFFYDNFSLTFITLELFPFFCYMVGRKFNGSVDQLNAIFEVIVWVFLVNASYAIIDLFFLPETLWSGFLDQGNYLKEIKGAPEETVINNLIGNFYFDPYFLKIRRAIGFQGDPLAFAYSITLPLITVLYNKDRFKKYYYIILSIFIGALLLSLTRAIIISAIFIIVLEKFFKKKHILIAMLTGIFIMLLLASLSTKEGQSILQYSNDSSTQGHLTSLSSFFDRDIESVILGSFFSGSVERYSYESAFLSILVTYGFLFVTIFYLFIYRMIKALYEANFSYAKALALTGSIGMFTSIVFSQSFFSFTGFGMFWLMAGVTITVSANKTKFYENSYRCNHTSE